MKLLKKKAENGERISEADKAAKLSVLDALDQMMDDQNAEGMKKVTVMSPNKEGLEAGLEKAKEVVEKKEAADEAECEMCEEEGYDHEMSEESEIDRLRARLAELEA
jgi:hypothetical protein